MSWWGVVVVAHVVIIWSLVNWWFSCVDVECGVVVVVAGVLVAGRQEERALARHDPTSHLIIQ